MQWMRDIRDSICHLLSCNVSHLKQKLYAHENEVVVIHKECQL